ncbi:hypothetical protein MMC13_008533, partial [Lambiella insularis]|nr:hypothetical protein [Lambiella insularis]
HSPTSSPSSRSSSLFPSANSPPTPQNNSSSTLAQLRAAELSPPDSQDTYPALPHTFTDAQTNLQEEDGMVLDAAESSAMGGVGSSGVGVGVGSSGVGEGEREGEREREPGWGWKNKKAGEDYQRAMEGVLDKGFSLREFGDLFDAREGGGER